MKVSIDRERRIVWITDVSARWACWAGYYFSANEPGLTNSPLYWHIFAYEGGDGQAVFACRRLEHYQVVADTKCAGAIAGLVKNPPSPVHDCPSCECPPECCK